MPNEGGGNVVGRRYVLGVVRHQRNIRGRNLLLLGLGGLRGDEKEGMLVSETSKHAWIFAKKLVAG